MRLLLTAAILLILSIPAQAAHRYHHNHKHHHVSTHHTKHWTHRYHRRHSGVAHYLSRKHRARTHKQSDATEYHGGGLVSIQTAAGRITVAGHLASRFQALVADFVAHGYRPRHIGCYASGGHVPNSRHYAGAACDFDQRGWGLTTSFMYHAHAIIAKHGFRDGCSFADCGHVDDGLPLHGHRYYAQGRHGRHYTRYARRNRDDDDSFGG